MTDRYIAATADAGALAVNKLIRNTYMLLSITLLFSAFTATVSTLLQMPPATYLVCIIAALVMVSFVLPKTANSSAGLITVFGITGLMGFALGPVLNFYLAMANGSSVVTTALGGTGVIFMALSGYALTTRKDFSFMGGFLFVGLIVAIAAMILNWFFAVPALSMAISAAVILIMSGYILYDTSRMVNGGETNYLHATVQLYLNIFNIFISLLRLLGIASSDD